MKPYIKISDKGNLLTVLGLTEMDKVTGYHEVHEYKRIKKYLNDERQKLDNEIKRLQAGIHNLELLDSACKRLQEVCDNDYAKRNTMLIERVVRYKPGLGKLERGYSY